MHGMRVSKERRKVGSNSRAGLAFVHTEKIESMSVAERSAAAHHSKKLLGGTWSADKTFMRDTDRCLLPLQGVEVEPCEVAEAPADHEPWNMSSAMVRSKRAKPAQLRRRLKRSPAFGHPIWPCVRG